MNKLTMEHIQAYDKARKSRDKVIDFYGGAAEMATRLEVTTEAVRMWKSRRIAIPEGTAWKVVAWGDFSFGEIRPDLIGK